MNTQIMIAIAVIAVVLIVVLYFGAARFFREAKYDFMRFALFFNNCCLLGALVHLVYLHKDYYAFGYLAPIFASYALFFSRKFKDLN